jgi:hypothetical protein
MVDNRIRAEEQCMIRRRLAATLATVATCALTVGLATPQMPDVIEIAGASYSLLVNPLEGYFAKHPTRRPTAGAQMSGNWRGYVAHFAVAGSALVVTDVRVLTEPQAGRFRSVLADVFGADRRPVATWFTGNLVVGDGTIVRDVYMGYGSEYERYIVVEVKAGVAAQPRRLGRSEFATFRQAQFEAYKRTDEYRRRLDEASRDDSRLDVAQFERFMFDFASADYVTRIFE